jgi:hypothetical protein
MREYSATFGSGARLISGLENGLLGHVWDAVWDVFGSEFGQF